MGEPMRSVALLLVSLSTFFVAQSASATIVSYRFSASFSFLEEINGGISAPESFFGQAKGLDLITGKITYDKDGNLNHSDELTASYTGFSEILLDQFSTASPDRVPESIEVARLFGEELFFNTTSIFVSDPPGLYNSIQFSFASSTGTFLTDLDIPFEYTLDDLTSAVIRVRTDEITGNPEDTIPARIAVANFNITTLERIVKVPSPNSTAIILTGLFLLLRHKKRMRIKRILKL